MNSTSPSANAVSRWCSAACWPRPPRSPTAVGRVARRPRCPALRVRCPTSPGARPPRASRRSAAPAKVCPRRSRRPRSSASMDIAAPASAPMPAPRITPRCDARPAMAPATAPVHAPANAKTPVSVPFNTTVAGVASLPTRPTRDSSQVRRRPSVPALSWTPSSGCGAGGGVTTTPWRRRTAAREGVARASVDVVTTPHSHITH
mmetsp:Transcript_21875/g.54092  ORF Transcript_21875/g.54092 Transcript_21875/m.54092 type:complete len:204 (+) Transcript_21875:2169-2780(+)